MVEYKEGRMEDSIAILDRAIRKLEVFCKDDKLFFLDLDFMLEDLVYLREKLIGKGY